MMRSPKPTPKILAFGDSPTRHTGFARVVRNVLTRWHRSGLDVACVGIGFEGEGYERLPFQIYPGGTGDWNSPARLSALLQRLDQGGYTHLWMLMDPDALSDHGFPEGLRRVAQAKGIRVTLYYPLDATPERAWLGIMKAVDAPVAYTEHARRVTRAVLGQSEYPITVIPHGVDDCFVPLSVEQRRRAREMQVRVGQEPVRWLNDGTLLLLNVNKNEWRKDLLRSLEILARLRDERDVPAKLILRTQPVSSMGGIVIELAAAQLGLTHGKEYVIWPSADDAALVALYNAADLYLTTTLGEGWGLGVTEAMGCHCPVAMPNHTSLAEIGLGEPVTWLPQEDGVVCGGDTRLRRRVDLAGAVDAITDAYRQGRIGRGVRCAPAAGHLWSWNQVAERMRVVLLGEPEQG